MKKILIWITSLLILAISGTSKVLASENETRVAQMHTVLVRYHSPMVGLENILIQTAESYQLDWTLLAAIAGTESSFAIHMPVGCNNPYGWGIYGDNKLCFESLAESIRGVAAGLASSYNTSSLADIARTYNKVSTAGWIAHTTYFMNQIKSATVPVSSLPITL